MIVNSLRLWYYVDNDIEMILSVRLRGILNMEGFRIQNIKSFKDSGYIQIRPITVFIGRNSSGKSSLIRFPLVLRQSVQSNFVGPLIFNNDSYEGGIDYGNLDDVVFNYDVDLPISFSVGLNLDVSVILSLEELINIDLLGYFESGYPVVLTVKIKSRLKDNFRQLYISEFILSINEEIILNIEFLRENKYLFKTYGIKKSECEHVFENFLIGHSMVDKFKIKDLDERLIFYNIYILVLEFQKNILGVFKELSYIDPFRTMLRVVID